MRHLSRIIVVIGIALACSSSLAADQVKLVPVTASAWGASKSEAIKAALGEAVAQVTGRAIAAETSMQTKSSESVENDTESYSREKTTSQNVAESYRGVVDSYEVIDVIASGSGWEASVSARVARLVASKSKRKPLAIFPFTFGREAFAVLGQHFDSAEASRLFTQAVVEKVTSSRRFMVVDREFLEVAQKEASLVVDNPMVPMSRLMEIANTVVAEYMVVGQLEGFTIVSQKRELKGFDQPFVTRQANVSVTYRVIDVASNQVKYAGTDVFSFANDEIAGGTQSVALATTVLSKAAERLSETMLDAIYPILVAGVSGERLTLNQGGDLVKRGSVYDIYRYGEKIFDPYSRESLGREEIPVGTVTISEVRPKMSFAMLGDVEEDIETDFAPRKYVLRLKKRGVSSDARARSESHQAAKQRISDKKAETDKDW
jgi:curli biogenesis system outer membrane secretion channel CsgG